MSSYSWCQCSTTVPHISFSNFRRPIFFTSSKKASSTKKTCIEVRLRGDSTGVTSIRTSSLPRPFDNFTGVELFTTRLTLDTPATSHEFASPLVTRASYSPLTQISASYSSPKIRSLFKSLSAKNYSFSAQCSLTPAPSSLSLDLTSTSKSLLAKAAGLSICTAEWAFRKTVINLTGDFSVPKTSTKSGPASRRTTNYCCILLDCSSSCNRDPLSKQRKQIKVLGKYSKCAHFHGHPLLALRVRSHWVCTAGFRSWIKTQYPGNQHFTK